FYLHISYTIPYYTDVLLYAPYTTEIYTLSLHDALPIYYIEFEPLTYSENNITSKLVGLFGFYANFIIGLDADSFSLYGGTRKNRSEEHTSELQSRENLVCRLLLEKKKKKYITNQKNSDI